MNISLALGLWITGSDDDPRWAAGIRPDFTIRPERRYCCETGHRTPEEAARHGSELAAQWLGAAARQLRPPQHGALVIQKIEAA